NGNSWLLQRGFGFTVPGNPPSPVALAPLCMSRKWEHDAGAGGWTWDFQADPHGLNANGMSVNLTPGYAHPLARPTLVVGSVAWFDPGYGYGITDGAGYGPANKWSQLGPTFAGK